MKAISLRLMQSEPTFTTDPSIALTVAQRIAARDRQNRRSRWRNFFRRIHVARFSPTEIVESNLPIK